jgi:hypothetical protein
VEDDEDEVEVEDDGEEEPPAAASTEEPQPGPALEAVPPTPPVAAADNDDDAKEETVKEKEDPSVEEEPAVVEDSPPVVETPAVATADVYDEEQVVDKEESPVVEDSTPPVAEEPAMAAVPSPVGGDDDAEVMDEEAPPVLDDSVAAAAPAIAPVPPQAKTMSSAPKKNKSLVEIDDGAATPRITNAASNRKSTNAASNKKSVSPSVVPRASSTKTAPSDEESALPESVAADGNQSEEPSKSTGNWWSNSSVEKKRFMVFGGLAVLLIVILAIAIPVSRNNNSSPSSEAGPPQGGSPSDAPGPSPSPTGDEEAGADPRSRQGINEMLSSISADGGTALNTKNSAQDLALTWLMNNTYLEDYSDAKLIQRYALATLYYATNGARWKDKWGWLSDADECKPDGWFQSKGALEESLCNENGNLIQLKLFFNRMDGMLPEELGLLSESLGASIVVTCSIVPECHGVVSLPLFFTEVLDLSSNNLQGPIPNAIGEMTLLRK